MTKFQNQIEVELSFICVNWQSVRKNSTGVNVLSAQYYLLTFVIFFGSNILEKATLSKVLL